MAFSAKLTLRACVGGGLEACCEREHQRVVAAAVERVRRRAHLVVLVVREWLGRRRHHAVEDLDGLVLLDVLDLLALLVGTSPEARRDERVRVEALGPPGRDRLPGLVGARDVRLELAGALLVLLDLPVLVEERDLRAGRGREGESVSL